MELLILSFDRDISFFFTSYPQLLSTVQLYINIVGPVVEALKYVSSLGYDVLTCEWIIYINSSQTWLKICLFVSFLTSDFE